MKNNIKQLLEKQQSAQKTANNYREAIEALQKVCEHSWNYQGHGHNDSLYICNICNKEEWK
jgi:hypothetical protein